MSSDADVLVVAPHADDEVLGCGGTIARWVLEGRVVDVVVVTRGEGPRYSVEDSEMLVAESEAARGVLGYREIHRLDLPLTGLGMLPSWQISDILAGLMGRLRPSTVLIPYGADRHVDHRHVFDACMVAARPVEGRDHLRRVWAFEVVSGTHWTAPGVERGFDPDVFVDVSSTLDHKLLAMRCYKSQLGTPPGARSLEALQSLARWRGSTAGMLAAEAFVGVRHYYPEDR